MVKINGINTDACGVNLAKYLGDNGYSLDKIAVEYNGKILSRSEYQSVILSDGDSVEIVSFVGGG